MRHNRIAPADSGFNAVLLKAIGRAAASGMPETLICKDDGTTQQRYAVLLQPASGTKPAGNVSCLVCPLGRRRIASARQLMSMFALSAAEARLTRALCHGETLEEYAIAQGVKLPTVKTQLRSLFSKTQTDRQVALVSLIIGIPPLR